MNYLAVRAVSMDTFNRQRANIVFSALIEDDIALSPQEASRQERVFERDGVLRWKSKVVGFCRIGVALHEMLISSGAVQESLGSATRLQIELGELTRVFEREKYLLSWNPQSREAMITLKKGATPVSAVKGWTHALLLAKATSSTRTASAAVSGELTSMQELELSLADHSQRFDKYVERLRAAGWDFDSAALETASGYRIAVQNSG